MTNLTDTARAYVYLLLALALLATGLAVVSNDGVALDETAEDVVLLFIAFEVSMNNVLRHRTNDEGGA